VLVADSVVEAAVVVVDVGVLVVAVAVGVEPVVVVGVAVDEVVVVASVSLVEPPNPVQPASSTAKTSAIAVRRWLFTTRD
jgi:hypothetical protein